MSPKLPRPSIAKSKIYYNNPMKPKTGVTLIGTIEIAVGSITLIANLQGLLTGTLPKPPNVLTFVITSSLISVFLGTGLLLRWHEARKLLMFFAGWVILSKILIFGGIIVLCCELETAVSADAKNMISIFYHLFVIYYCHTRTVKKEFGI